MAGPTVEERINECIRQKKSFILDAAAGSGKTWTLVQTLNSLIVNQGAQLEKLNQKIACITYTNVAKDEIIARTEHNELIRVSTIHDFLWDCIKNFQKELRDELIIIVCEKLKKKREERAAKKKKNTKTYEELSKVICKHEEAKEALVKIKPRINYTNFPNYEKGNISHNELLDIAREIFRKYNKISRTVSDAYPIILIDEYQDTLDQAIEILLDHLKTKGSLVLGFFGDRVQHIYDTGIGGIDERYRLELIQKEENYRSSEEVIQLLNRIRKNVQPKIEQYQARRGKKKGSIGFYYLPNPSDFNASEFIKNSLNEQIEKASPEQFKILYLTHRYIAKEEKYEELFNLYQKNKKRDALISNEKNRGFCPFADFLYDLEEIADLFGQKRTQQLLKKTYFKINTYDDVCELRESLHKLLELRESQTIGAVIAYTENRRILLKTERMEIYDFDDEKKEQFFNALMDIEYKQFLRLYQVQKSKTPFSTKHGTKGDQFENVLVVIDDGAWVTGKYKFNNFFAEVERDGKNYMLTRNLFYVVCSRAVENLAVVCTSELNNKALEKIKEFFLDENFKWCKNTETV